MLHSELFTAELDMMTNTSVDIKTLGLHVKVRRNIMLNIKYKS